MYIIICIYTSSNNNHILIQKAINPPPPPPPPKKKKKKKQQQRLCKLVNYSPPMFWNILPRAQKQSAWLVDSTPTSEYVSHAFVRYNLTVIFKTRGVFEMRREVKQSGVFLHVTRVAIIAAPYSPREHRDVVAGLRGRIRSSLHNSSGRRCQRR